MERIALKLHWPAPNVPWALALVFLASGLVHVNYVLFFGGGVGQWFRSWPNYFTVSWVLQLLGLFGPSAVLALLWLKSKRRVWPILLAILLAYFAYQSWQPLILNILSALELYPTHLEAFHNVMLRDDWLRYE